MTPKAHSSNLFDMSRKPRRISDEMAVILKYFLGIMRAAHGMEIMKETNLTSGTVYPALSTLADRGILDHDWDDSTGQGTRRRHVYWLATGPGDEHPGGAATDALAEWEAAKSEQGKPRLRRLRERPA